MNELLVTLGIALSVKQLLAYAFVLAWLLIVVGLAATAGGWPGTFRCSSRFTCCGDTVRCERIQWHAGRHTHTILEWTSLDASKAGHWHG